MIFCKRYVRRLEEHVELGELTSEELPTIKTIEGWINRFAASHKKSMAQKILEENQNKNQWHSKNSFLLTIIASRNYFMEKFNILSFKVIF